MAKEEKNIPKMTEEQKLKIMQKQAARELADYKKRISDAVSIKTLQNQELKLNIEYYELRMKWLDIQPKIDELEKREQEFAAMKQAKEQAVKEQNESKQVPNQENKIITVEQGSPRK